MSKESLIFLPYFCRSLILGFCSIYNSNTNATCLTQTQTLVLCWYFVSYYSIYWCTYEKAPIPKGFISIRLLIKSNIPFGTYKKALLYNKALF